MPIYMVERNLPGITMEQLAGAQREAIETGKRMTAEGKTVRYIRSMFVPGEARCMCLLLHRATTWIVPPGACRCGARGIASRNSGRRSSSANGSARTKR